MSKFASLILMFPLLCSCTGGEKTVEVTGQLLINGQAVVPSEKRIVQIAFVPNVPPQNVKNSYTPTIEKGTSNYRVALPPGEYRIGVQQYDASAPTTDMLKGQYHIDRSKLIHDIQEDTQLNLELKVPGGAR